MANIIEVVLKARDATAAAWKSAAAKARKLAKDINKNLAGRVGRAAKQAAAGIALVGAAAAAAAVKFIGFASSAEEVSTKFDAVFAASGKAADSVASDLANSFGLADSTAKELLSSTGDILTGFGFTSDEALDLSDKVARLGSDLASFTNFSKGASGASAALTKLLLGETEQAKSLGIVVRQGSEEFKDAVKAQMAATGQTETQAKALVALRMATEQSKNAIGDFERTQDSVTNRTRVAKEALKSAREEIGKAIIENSGYADILALVTKKAKELVESGAIELWAKNVRAAVTGLADLIKPIVGPLGKLIKVGKEAVQVASGFAGALSAGASLAEASEIALSIPDTIAKEQKQQLATIRKAREERQKAKEEAKEEASVAAKLREETDKAAKAAERAAKANKERADALQKVADINQQLGDIAAGDEVGRFQDRAKAAADEIGKIQKQLDGINNRRQNEQADRAEKNASRREKELRRRQERGTKLAPEAIDFLAKRDLTRKLAQEQADKAKAEENAALRQKTIAERQRRRQIKVLKDTKKLLEKNLQAG